MKKFEGNNLQLAKYFLRDNWEIAAGVDCPCCSQRVKLYKRHITDFMSTRLINLYRISDKGTNRKYFHITEICASQNGGDFSRLERWGLITPEPNDPPTTKRTNGMWRISELGIDFVENKVSVPKTKFMFNNAVYRTSEDAVTIEDTLKETFDFSKLMQGADHG